MSSTKSDPGYRLNDHPNHRRFKERVEDLELCYKASCEESGHEADCLEFFREHLFLLMVVLVDRIEELEAKLDGNRT